jgi:hypothetical protein
VDYAAVEREARKTEAAKSKAAVNWWLTLLTAMGEKDN